MLSELRRQAQAFLAGSEPQPYYLHGPRGIGKSHVLAMLHATLADDGVRVVYVGEDLPEFRSAADLLRRIDAAEQAPPWHRRETARSAKRGRRILLIEGFDRQLRALGATGRGELRRAFRADLELWVVATGLDRGAPFDDDHEAFHHVFRGWPLGELGGPESAALLSCVAFPRSSGSQPRGAARRATLVSLAGGHARSLMALGQALGEAPQSLADEHLRIAVQHLTPHYQERFREHSPDGQRLLAGLAGNLGEMTPRDLARDLGWSPQKASVLANRATADGVVRQRTETDVERARARERGADVRGGAASLFRISEPLFRYWIESRSAPWTRTRISLVARFLERLLTVEDGSPPDRLDRLAGALPQTWEGAVSEATTMVDLLERAPRGLLHPELEELRRLLTKESPRVDRLS